MSTDPISEKLGRDNLRLRALLEAVARDLETLAARDAYAEHTTVLLRRAMRIRRHLARESIDEGA